MTFVHMTFLPAPEILAAFTAAGLLLILRRART